MHKPGVLLLKAGLGVSGICVVVLGVLSYGWSIDVDKSMVAIFLLLPVFLLSVPVLVYTTVASAYLIGMPAVNILYGWQAAKRNWRGVIGVLLIIDAAVSILVAVLPPHSKAKQLPTADEFFGPPPDREQCIAYGFKEGTDAYAQCRMTIDQQHRAGNAARAGRP